MNPIFHVLTEFKFEIGSAVTSSKTLQGAVEDLSHAADQALFSFQKMGVGLVAQMGLGTGGVLGVLYESIQASEKFSATQRKLANIFLSNQDKIKGGPVSFLEAMEASNDIMTEIQAKARAFALPASALTNMVGAIAPALFNAGVAGSNLENAITMSRGLLKSAPTLGVDVNLVQGQLLDLVMGRGSAGDTLSQRLMNETTAFREVLGPSAGNHGTNRTGGSSSPLAAFNVLPIAKRVEVLNKALLQFGSNSEVLKANAESLTQQFQVLTDSLKGMFSILRPVGEALANFLAPALQRFNTMIQTNGAQISNQLGMMLKKVLGDPENLIENLFQVKSLKRDLESTTRVFSIAGIFGFIGVALKTLGVTARFVSPWVAALGGAFSVLFDVWMRTPSVLWKIFLFSTGIAALVAALVLFPPLGGILATAAALTGLFQLFSRAEGIAKVEDAKKMVQIGEDLSRVTNAFMTTMGRILQPFGMLFDYLAHMISPIFQVSSWIEFLTNALFKLTYMFSFLEASILALGEAASKFMNYFTSSQMLSNPSGIVGAVGSSFSSKFDQIMSENLASLSDPNSGAVVKQITNINGDININNAFKEQMEPDRIAFTLVDQLRKVAQNPVSAPGRSLGGALAR